MEAIPTGRVAHEAPIKLVAFSPDGNRLATADVDRMVAFWSREGETWRRQLLIDLHHCSDRFRALDIVRALVFDSTGDYVFVGSGETLRALRFDDGTEAWSNDAIPDFSFLITTPLEAARGPEGLVSVCYADGTIESYRETPIPVRRRDPEGPVFIGYVGGTKVLAGCDYYRLALYDGESLETLKSWRLVAKAFKMAVHPLQQLIAFRTLDDVVLFDLESGSVKAKHPARAGLPFLVWSLDGQTLVNMDAWGFQFFDASLNLIGRVDTEVRALSITPDPHGGWFWTGSDGVGRSIDSVSAHSV